MRPEKKSLIFHVVDDSISARMKESFENLEEQLKIEGLATTLYQVVMELIGNAIKANIKRIYFERKGLSIDDPEDYARGIEGFSAAYPVIDRENYARAMQDLDLHVSLEIDLDARRLLIFVENNTVLVPEEENRIRAKLAGAMDVKDVMEFFKAYGDDLEGRGLGLAMIVFLIRDLGFPAEHFRVFKTDTRTIARIEFPLDTNYSPTRSQAIGS